MVASLVALVQIAKQNKPAKNVQMKRLLNRPSLSPMKPVKIRAAALTADMIADRLVPTHGSKCNAFACATYNNNA